jgi:Cu/Ag efflux pump CusA
MTPWLLSKSVSFRYLVIAGAIVILGLSATQLRSARVDTYPEFTPASVQIQTEARGLSAAEVEQLITVPLEQDLLNGIPWLKTIRSESMTGLSSIDLVFEPGTDIFRARQVTQERLTQAVALPNVGTPPVMVQPVSSTSRVAMLGLSSAELSPLDLSVLARWKIRPALMSIPGVASVSVWGQRDRQLQVLVDPDKLARNGVSLNQVVDTTGNALWVSSLTFVEASTPGTGGFIDTPNQRFGVQHVFPITTAKQLSSVTVSDTSGKKLRLSDVAQVVEDHQPLIGDASIADDQGLMLVIQKFPGANVADVTRAIDDVMATLRPGLSGVRIDGNVYRPSSFLSAALSNVGWGAALGFALLIVVLAVMLLSWRRVLIAATTLLVALTTAAYVLHLRGATFTTMSLAGFAVALGMVVNDAVTSGADASRHGGSRVRGPSLIATLVLMLAVATGLLLDGVGGSFAYPIVTTAVLALLASMVVSLTLAPALAAVLYSGSAETESRLQPRISPLVRWAQQAMDRVVPWLARRHRGYLALAALVIVGCAAVPQLGSHPLLPTLHDRDLLVHLSSAPGTGLSEMSRITMSMSRELRETENIAGVGAHVGRGHLSDQVVNANSGELWVRIAPHADIDRTTKAVERVVSGYPGVAHRTSSYPADQLRTAVGAPDHPLTVRLFGQDLAVLRTEAAKVQRELSGLPGVRNAVTESVVEEPTLQITVNLAAADRYNMKPGDVRRAATTLVSGLPVGNLYEQQKIFDVVVWGTPTTRRSLSDVRDLWLDTPSGSRIRLRDIADVRIAPYPSVVKHDDVRRSLDVTAEVDGRSLGEVRSTARDHLRALTFPLEYHAEVLGDSGTAAAGGNDVGGEGQASRWLMVIALAIAAAIVLVVQAVVSRWRTTAMVLVTLPLGVVGGALTAPLSGGIRSLGALLGLLTVLGMTLRASLILATASRSAREQAAPILTTALATAAVVAPFVFFGSVAGLETLHPFAVTVLGALVSFVVLTLFVLPALSINLAPHTGSEGDLR